MKIFQGLLGCLLIICYVQYNVSAAPSQFHNYRRQVNWGPFIQTAYTVYACDFLTLRSSVQSYLDGEENHLTCTYNLTCENAMSHSLSQRYAVSLSTTICENMVFYESFIAKIRSSSWATDADAQFWICYMDDLNFALYYLQLLLHRRTPYCPTYTNQELLTIYRCNRDIFHSPDNKYCVMYSFKHDSGGRSDPDGINAGHQGCDTDYNVPPPC